MEGNADKSNRNLSRNIITAIAALLAVVIFVLYFIRNFTFSFLPLLCILFLLMIIIGTKIREFRINPDKTIVASATSALLVFTFGALCLFTLDNYINPSKDIFRNNDHHTLVAEGFHIKDTRHIELAGNNSEALFDNETFNGSIFLDKTRQEIRGNDTIKIVSLQEKGFSTPIYSRHRESLNWIQKLFRDNRPYFKDIDSESAEIFSQGDTIVLSRGKATASFCIKEWKDSLGASYFLTYTDKSGRLQQVESPFTAYLRRSYPLSAMFQNTDIPGLNLNGIVLYRTVFFDTQVDNVRKRYKRLGARYRLALENSSDKNIRIWIQGHSFDPTHETKTFDLKADGTTVYAIGTTEEAAPQFRLYPEKKGISLRYRMPKYRYLSADYTQEQETENLEEITFMVASTILDPDGSVSQLIPENILLYDIFDHPNNIHQLRPAFLTFVSGPTNSRLKFSLYSTDGSIDSKDLVAGSLCPELPTSDDNVSWIISIDNFKDNTLVRPGEIQQPQSARTIAIILIVVTLLSVITIMIHGGKRYTYVEPMVYLVLLAFLTIRLFLLWRISVFPPVMSTTVSEFNGIFRNPTSLSYIILFLAGFYAVILTVKIFGIKNGSPLLNLLYRDPSTYCSSEKLKRGFYYAIFGEPLLLIVMAVVLRSVHFTDRFFCVLLPIVIFFVVDYLANRFYGGRYREKYAQDVDLRYLWVLMANSIGTTIYTFVMDGGFGIIFLLFSVTNITLRMIDAYLYKGHDRHKVYINRWIYTLSVFAIFILTFSKKILLQLLDGLAFAITVFIIMTVVYIAILLMFNIIRFEHRHLADKIKTMKIIGAGVLAIALFSTTTIWAPRLFEGNHIEYRLKVQSDDPGNVLGKLQSATAERKFLEASINDWVMGEYNLRGKMINVVGERGSGYFKVQPQSKVGALWGAQTTDISLSRYVIAEHGQLLAIMLIVILGTLLNFCISFVSNRIWSKALITQIPLLLSIQALLVWMAVTQRFIFLGQDFPMISVTSNLTSILFIGLMAVLVVVALIESTLCLDRQERSHAIDLIIINRRMSGHVRLFTSLILILLLINQRYQSFYQKKTDTATRYDVKSSLEALKISINAFNEEFIAYQQQVMDSLSRGRRPIRDITQTPIGASPYQCLWAYCRDNQYDPNTPGTEENTASLPNYFRIVGESYSGFCKMAFDRYLKNGVRKNDIYGLIFTVKKKSRIDGRLNIVYELKVYNQYYARELPRTIKDSWKGSIVSLPVGISTDSIAPISQERGFTVYTLPQSWTRAEEPVRLLKSMSQNLVVVGKQRPQVLRRGESCYLYESDNVLVNGRNADVSKYGNVSFLAKNVLINGAFTFVYPLQNKLFWMRSFSNCVQIDKASYDVDNEASKEDIYVTLSPTLTSDIYDTFDRMRPTMMSAAVVADGNGNIVAMVDHKDPKHRLNPNDLKSIVKKETELRLEGEYYWGQEAENYFGNKSITNLRFGPGSSQKPLVWSAVTTQYNDTDFWQRLKLARINPHLMESTDNSHFSTRFLAGTLLSRGTRVRGTRRYAYFQSLKGDEGGGENAVDLTAYLYKSSNYYNAVMTFIGSYSYDDLTIGLDTKDPEASLFQTVDAKLLTSKMAEDTLKYRMAFPIMQLGNGKPFAFKSIPSLDIIENADNSLLVKGLNINFNLPSEMDRTLRPEIYQYKTERVRNRSDFAHPQASYFLNKYRADALDKARADYAIRYTALGASSVWQVSPLMMAQMYGGLISLNRNYTLSIMPKEEDDLEYERFEIDNVPSTYDNIGSYFNIRSTFIKSLSMVFHERGGTGNHVFNLLRTYKKDTNDGALLATAVDGSEKKLFLYGKTGTINGTDNTGTSQEDHLFAVIITDTDLEEAKSVETHEKMKFYVIYIADFGRQGWVASDAAVIDTVLASKEFKHYMGIK